jgi:hypothetical protein
VARPMDVTVAVLDIDRRNPMINPNKSLFPILKNDPPFRPLEKKKKKKKKKKK